MDPEQRVDPSSNGQDEKFSTRLVRELEAEHGVEFEMRDTAHESFMVLLREALDRLPAERRQDTAMGVIADYAAFTGAKLTRQARDHTAKLVRTHDPPRVLEAYGEATLWGAGLNPEHAEDPLALSKYVAGCLSKWKESA